MINSTLATIGVHLAFKWETYAWVAVAFVVIAVVFSSGFVLLFALLSAVAAGIGHHLYADFLDNEDDNERFFE